MSSYPSIEEYSNALQASKRTIRDPLLSQGVVQLNNWGIPLARNGTFALTYKITAKGRDYAFRCFQRDRPGMHDRYAAISSHLKDTSISYFVEFEYLSDGITIMQRNYPAIRMDWAEGEPLGSYIEWNIKDSGRLRVLRQQLHGMAFALEGAGIAHGDIQTNNILVAPSGEIHLVDYDGMYVPSIARMGALESGHRNFQHPERENKSPYDATLDRFAFALMHCSLSALIENPTLWKTLAGDPEALLLRATDFAATDMSAGFKQLVKLPSSGPAFVRLKAICDAPYDQIPTFNDFLAGRNTPVARRAGGVKQESQSSSANTIWYKEASRESVTSISSQAPVPTQRQSEALPVRILDAKEYQKCMEAIGDEVVAIGQVKNVARNKPGATRLFARVTLGSQAQASLTVILWSAGMRSMSASGLEIDESWLGKWVAVSGKITLKPDAWGPPSPAIVVDRAQQIEILTSGAARYRLSKDNASKSPSMANRPTPAPSPSPAPNRSLLSDLQGSVTPTSLPPAPPPMSAGNIDPTPSDGPSGWIIFCILTGVVVLIVLFALFMSQASSGAGGAGGAGGTTTPQPIIESATQSPQPMEPLSYFTNFGVTPMALAQSCWAQDPSRIYFAVPVACNRAYSLPTFQASAPIEDIQQCNVGVLSVNGSSFCLSPLNDGQASTLRKSSLFDVCWIDQRGEFCETAGIGLYASDFCCPDEFGTEYLNSFVFEKKEGSKWTSDGSITLVRETTPNYCSGATPNYYQGSAPIDTSGSFDFRIRNRIDGYISQVKLRVTNI